MRNALIFMCLLLPCAAQATACGSAADTLAAQLSLSSGLRAGIAPAQPVSLAGGATPLLGEVLARQQAQTDCSPAGDGYVKQTEFDNTPYRFNMKPGQKLSAAEFDAWMESRGIRIVRAKPAEATPATVSQ